MGNLTIYFAMSGLISIAGRCSRHYKLQDWPSHERELWTFLAKCMYLDYFQGSYKSRTMKQQYNYRINWDILLYGLFIPKTTSLAFFAKHSVKLSCWRFLVTVFTLYPLKVRLLPGYWDADHDWPRTRSTRPSNAQCTTRALLRLERTMNSLCH